MFHRFRLFIVPLALAALSALSIPATAEAQSVSLRGRFRDAATRGPVGGASIKLTNLADTTDVRQTAARDSGEFQFAGLVVGRFRIEATRVGYAPFRTVLQVTQPGQDAGVLAMTPQSVPLTGIEVTESPAPATQKGDTTEFRAGAVKTHREATAEDLVQKLPGVTMENGQVKAHGENVQQVLVNGRPFMGSDPTAAMRNLPAEEIDRIQVYDRMSDQAEFSGFDDGSSQKTMNFILRDQKAQFGKATGGYGDRDRYQAGGNATMIRGATRLTLLGMSNNINQRNFAHQDLAGVMGGGQGGGGGQRIMIGGPRGGGGGSPQMFRFGGGGGGSFDPGSFLIGGQQGLSTTHSGGLNFTDQWGRKLTFTTSLFSNDTDTDNRQSLTREYLPPQDSLAFYEQAALTDSRNQNHRLDARLEWTPDSINSVIVQPRAYFQHNRGSNTALAANTTLSGDPLSAATNDTHDAVDAAQLSARSTVRHRFAKRGRNVSADLNLGHNLRDSDASQRSFTDYYDDGGTTTDTLDQVSDARTRTNSMSARVALTEPLGHGVQMQAIWNPSRTASTSDAHGFRFDPAINAYTLPDSALTNSYESRHTTQAGGLAVLYSFGPWKWLTNGSYQRATLRSEQTFPVTRTIERTFDDVLPSMSLTANFANRRNLRLGWNTSSTAPTIAQLQNLTNNSNPLSLTSGNPDLRPDYTHSLSLRYSEADPLKSKSRFVFANVSRTSHPIANTSYTALTDTTIHGVFLARGTQLTRPENLDESWRANLFGVQSLPLTKLKSILSLNGGGSFTRTPTQLNDQSSVRNTWAIRSGAVLASNISERLDFTVSYQGTYNLSRSTPASASSGDYYTHDLGLRFNAVIGPGVIVRQEVNHRLQSGVPSAYGQDVVLWNSTIGKRLLKDGRGEFRLTTTDVLEQDRSVGRNITDSYVQDTRDRTLGRFVQAVFSYSWK